MIEAAESIGCTWWSRPMPVKGEGALLDALLA
jgi:hypothetical protein